MVRRNYSIMDGRMNAARMAELLSRFTTDAPLSRQMLNQLQLYLDLLLRWNVRINLTAIRTPEEIVTRHFCESLFAARMLLPKSRREPSLVPEAKASSNSYGPPVRGPEGPLFPVTTLADVGSGAGFPGIPMKLFAPELALILIESHNKKATFLREVIRALQLDRAEVFCGRAERWGKTADLVTLRAVEQYERVLPAAASLVAPNGRLCLLVGAGQVPTAHETLGASWMWREPIAVPQSSGRVVLVGMMNRLYSSLPEADR